MWESIIFGIIVMVEILYVVVKYAAKNAVKEAFLENKKQFIQELKESINNGNSN